MGFSTSGAAAIVFLGLLVAIGIAYPVYDSVQEQRNTAVEDRDARALDMRNTAIAVNHTVYDVANETVTTELENVGATTLDVAATDLLVDGDYRAFGTDYETFVEDDESRTLWLPGESLTLSWTERTEPSRVKVVTEHGIAVTATDVGGGA